MQAFTDVQAPCNISAAGDGRTTTAPEGQSRSQEPLSVAKPAARGAVQPGAYQLRGSDNQDNCAPVGALQKPMWPADVQGTWKRRCRANGSPKQHTVFTFKLRSSMKGERTPTLTNRSLPVSVQGSGSEVRTAHDMLKERWMPAPHSPPAHNSSCRQLANPLHARVGTLVEVSKPNTNCCTNGCHGCFKLKPTSSRARGHGGVHWHTRDCSKRT